MKKFIFLLISLLLSFSVYSQKRDSTCLHYRFNRFSLTETHERTLRFFIDSVKKKKNLHVCIKGHTDSTGDLKYNMNLSKKRAEAVRNKLLDMNIQESKIECRHFGESQPLESSQTPSGRRKNRRVEVTVRTLENEQNDKPPYSIESFYSSLQGKDQVFQINPGSDTLLFGHEETILGIQGNSFDIPDSLRGEKISVFIKEVYSKSQMILHNLQTISDGQLLESGGMIDIRAEIEGVSLELQPDKSIEVIMPAKPFDDQMKLFTGAKDSLNHINWELSNDSLDNFENSFFSECYDYTFNLKRCPFFFCGIKRMFWSEKRKEKLRERREELKERAELLEQQCQLKKDFKERYEKRYGPLDAGKLRKLKAKKQGMKSYMFETNQLGWINIDKFAKLPEEKLARFKINVKPDIATDMHIVFEERQSVVSPLAGKDYYRVKGVPKGEMIKVVGVRAHPGSKSELAIEKLQTGSNNTVNLNFKECEREEMKKKMVELIQ
jgi:hypothetical protein